MSHIITVVCDAPSHRPLNIARMSIGVTGQWVSTGVTLNDRPRYERENEVTALIGDGNQPASDTEIGAKTARPRHSFTCPICGDSLPLRAETLDPILDRLAQHAVECISINGIRLVA